MKKHLGLRASAWEPRTRIILAVVTLAIVAATAVWWVGGATDRRLSSACGLYDGQQEPLHTLVDDVATAGEASTSAGTTVIFAYLDNADATLNVMRRWQSTMPRVADELGRVEAGGADEKVSTTLVALTDSVAELQRLIEADVAADAVTYAPEVAERLDEADALCG